LIRSRILSAAAAVAIVGGGVAAFAPAASAADTTLIACSGIAADAKLNPTLKSGDAKYIKASSSGTTGTCLVDEGIANNQGTQDVKYVLDDQTNNNNVLTMLTNKGSLAGSVSCNSTDTSLLTDYPASYPLQGKITWKFTQLNALSKNIALQMYVRGGRDELDPNPANFTISGIVIKGPGVGGDTQATLQFFPDLLSTKNLNILDCTANPATQNASLADLDVSQSDGSDAGTALDNWLVTIPA
jgi:uncharacterized protein YfcZ (UPF0381/DUF406 family)